MNTDERRQLEWERNNMQIILEFPIKSDNEVYIKNGIKTILASILQQHLNDI